MVQVLQTELFEQDIPSVVATVLARCQTAEKQNLLISASGAHGLVTAAQDAQFLLILQSFFLNLPDGMPSVWVGRLKGAQRMQRCYGPDFFREVILASAPYPIRHYFCGGKESLCKINRNYSTQPSLRESVLCDRINLQSGRDMASLCSP
jgi:N-acetylglucosaminyldiphosphoundecaprenol N-acetyl-beta-D-mannosaminyltransferase